MSMIEDIKRDREAGTPGPWSAFTDDTAPHTNIVSPVPHTSCVFSLAGRDKRHPDIDRLCRVPDMEAALIAAEELADAAECIRHWHDAMADGSGMVVSSEHVHKLREKVTAYRAATGAA